MAKRFKTLIFTSSTDSHSTGEVVAAPQKLAGICARQGAIEIQSVVLVDQSDTGAALDLVLLNQSVSIGDESATFTLSDANAEAAHIGTINILATDYDDNVDNQTATVSGLQMIVGPEGNGNDIYVGLVARGSINPAAADDIYIRIGYEE